jgi:hypothetical protein
MTVAVLSVVFFAKPLIQSHPKIFAELSISLGVTYALLAVALATWAAGRQRRIRQQESGVSGVAPGARASSFGTEPFFEYRSKGSLLGLPLIHIRLRAGIERGPVKAWIAMGDSAIGGLFALGGLAIAPISFGGGAVGLICFGGGSIGILSFGGISLGLFTVGGLAIGWEAYGGLALGWQAFGGCALGWNGAQGGLAIAHEWASGGVALARHANDQTAKMLSEGCAFFRIMQRINPYLPLANLLALFPFFLQRHAVKRQLEISEPKAS